MSERNFPRGISAENWRKALEETARKEAEEAKYWQPGEPPIVSTVEQQILEEILEQKDKPD